jgi:hypothetical protein
MASTLLNRSVPVVLFSMFGLLLSGPACQKAPKTATEHAAAQPGAEEAAGQRTFASPEEAGAALQAAIRSGDQTTLITLFGPDSSAVLFTNDEASDKVGLQNLANAYDQMHRWSKVKAGGEVLLIGTDNYPFPIPVGQNASGRWYFDTAAGKDEMLARRIGRNELKAMDACEAIANAQRQYYTKGKQYAQQLVSDPGKRNGLYWPATGGQAPSPLGSLDDFTKVLSSTEAGKPVLYDGYTFRVLTQGDSPVTRSFRILAYPIDYRQSGITSFVADSKGGIYQKDLGEHTADVAAAMTEFNSADGWTSTSPSTGTASRAQQ